MTQSLLDEVAAMKRELNKLTATFTPWQRARYRELFGKEPADLMPRPDFRRENPQELK